MSDETTAEKAEEAAKRPRKLMKELTDEGIIKIEAVGGNSGLVKYDFNSLPDSIKAKLGPFGLSHKLGDSAAGKTGAEAEEAIQKVWEGLMAGDWSVRAPATPKVSVKALVDKMNSLPEEAQAQARALLESLGVSIPS